MKLDLKGVSRLSPSGRYNCYFRQGIERTAWTREDYPEFVGCGLNKFIEYAIDDGNDVESKATPVEDDED